MSINADSVIDRIHRIIEKSCKDPILQNTWVFQLKRLEKYQDEKLFHVFSPEAIDILKWSKIGDILYQMIPKYPPLAPWEKKLSLIHI